MTTIDDYIELTVALQEIGCHPLPEREIDPATGHLKPRPPELEAVCEEFYHKHQAAYAELDGFVEQARQEAFTRGLI